MSPETRQNGSGSSGPSPHGASAPSSDVTRSSFAFAVFDFRLRLTSRIASTLIRYSTDGSRWSGARLVIASEIAKGRTWDENLIKTLTGGDRSARFMREDNFSFTPVLKLVVIGNHKPRLQSVNEATRRRFNIVPFDRTPVEPDDKLDEKLRAEATGILRWLIDGALDWQRNGLIRPQSVIEATEEYFSNQDLFGQWLEDECDVEPGNRWKIAKSGELFAAWAAYAKRAGENPGTKSISQTS